MTTGGGDHTITSGNTQAADEGASSVQPVLYLVIDANDPLAPPARFALGDVDEVVFGRGSARSVTREVSGGRRRLIIKLADGFLSSAHARMVRRFAWELEDSGSKNGSVVNGLGVQRHALADHDVIELGRTFLLFRAAVALLPDDTGDLDARRQEVVPGLATLLPLLRSTYALLSNAAASGVTIVLHGEVGTGKEVLARAIHALSGRTGAFVAVNCGALPRELVEAELFGHRKGAFSGAGEDRPGLVRSADGGTLFLDEIAELPLGSQVAFLRVLQEREVMPVGGARTIPVDLRVVAASHQDLAATAAAGRLRADLLSRLAGFTVELPPLRQRREDLGLLVAALLRRLTPAAAGVKLHPRTVRTLLRHDWPDNVRGLEKCLEVALVMARGAMMMPEHLPAAVLEAVPAAPAAAAAEPPTGSVEDAARREQIVALLEAHGGNLSAVARAMGRAPVQLRRWIKRYAIDVEAFRR